MKNEPSVLKSFATMRFEGDKLAPPVLTDAIGLDPTLSYRKGETFRLGRRGPEKTGKTGYWFINTKHHIDTNNIDDHVNFISRCVTADETCNLYDPKLENIRSIVRDEDLRVLVTLFWFGEAGAQLPVIDYRFRKLIGVLGGEIETDFMTESHDPAGIEGRAA